MKQQGAAARASRWFWFAALVLLSQGCAGRLGPSTHRLACLNACADYKDACILDARDGSGIRWCDGQYFECSRGCPR